MKLTEVILLTILLTQSACYRSERPEVCSPDPKVEGNFDLGVEDKGTFLIIFLHNKSKEEIYILEPPQSSQMIGTVKTKKLSVVCLTENPARSRSVPVPAGGAIELKVEKKKAITEINKTKSKSNFRFLYEGVYGGAYSGVCSMDNQTNIKCQPTD